MLIPVYLRSFERELEKAKKRGLDMSKIKTLINDLINEKPLIGTVLLIQFSIRGQKGDRYDMHLLLFALLPKSLDCSGVG